MQYRDADGETAMEDSDPDAKSVTDAFEEAIGRAGSEHYTLTLYVTGTTPQSNQALMNIKRICEERLQGRYDLEVIDIYQQPELAKGENIIAAPTLLKKLPLPLRRVIGNLSDLQRVLVGLDLQPRADMPRG
jgi:circadian clock protein KaiB